METKSMYYEIKVRIKNQMSNNGFVKVEIYDGIPCISGYLTVDIFIGLIEDEDKFKFSYYEFKYVKQTEKEIIGKYDNLFEFSINLEDFILPATYTYRDIEIDINYQINDPAKIKECNTLLKEVFNDEG